MTALRDILLRQIATTGPMPVSDYMTTCLLHPEHGYYTTRDPLGRAGDFITAPEISQMFGELIGLCLAQSWIDQGQPSPFVLAELGPGRGTLMADILRTTAKVPGFSDAVQVHLVEASPTLRASQSKLIPNATWHDNIDTLPQLPLFLVANEFFDALPIRQFVRDGAGWRERVIGAEQNVLTFGLSGAAPLSDLAHRLDDTQDGDLVETCPALPGIMRQISTRIETFGGAALIIDYGDWHSLGDTLQALKDHQTIDPLHHPGDADLTSHVDFEAIAQHASPAAFTRLTPQGVFLERLGITERAKTLATPLSGQALENHIAAHHRLTHPEQMGHLFKVIGIFPTAATPPPGLET